MKTFKNKDEFKTSIIKYILIGIENNVFKINIHSPSNNLSSLSNDYIFNCIFYEYDDKSMTMDFTFSNITDTLYLTKDEYNSIMDACYEHTYSKTIMNGLLDLITENKDNSHFSSDKEINKSENDNNRNDVFGLDEVKDDDMPF